MGVYAKVNTTLGIETEPLFIENMEDLSALITDAFSGQTGSGKAEARTKKITKYQGIIVETGDAPQEEGNDESGTEEGEEQGRGTVIRIHRVLQKMKPKGNTIKARKAVVRRGKMGKIKRKRTAVKMKKKERVVMVSQKALVKRMAQKGKMRAMAAKKKKGRKGKKATVKGKRRKKEILTVLIKIRVKNRAMKAGRVMKMRRMKSNLRSLILNRNSRSKVCLSPPLRHNLSRQQRIWMIIPCSVTSSSFSV